MGAVFIIFNEFSFKEKILYLNKIFFVITLVINFINHLLWVLYACMYGYKYLPFVHIIINNFYYIICIGLCNTFTICIYYIIKIFCIHDRL